MVDRRNGSWKTSPASLFQHPAFVSLLRSACRIRLPPPSPVKGLALFTYQAESAFETLPTFSVFFFNFMDTPDATVFPDRD
jgi:hypothetical protein